MKKLVIWALFDSGNGCYAQVGKQLNYVDIYSIGIDRMNKNHHFINLNLADYGRLFGDNTLFDTLDELPHPDLIIASPPCESWSVASAMSKGNACWKTVSEESRFTVRDRADFDKYQYKPEKSFMTRINGEMCAFNTIEIIRRYKPSWYVIENPQTSRIWDYIDQVLGFPIPFENKTYYNNYGFVVRKATKFKSNLNLNLKCENIKAEIEVKDYTKNYNIRSNIPLPLVQSIFETVSLEWFSTLDGELL